MKTRLAPLVGKERGILLIECIVYVGVSVVVLGLGFDIFFHAWDDSSRMRRNADEIVQVLNVGDQWRKDMREATGAIQLIAADAGEQIHIPAPGGEIIYTFAGGEIRRQAGGGDPERVWLSNVKTSQMLADPRAKVAAWRWEIELKPVKKNVLFRPLFTFETVAGGKMTQ